MQSWLKVAKQAGREMQHVRGSIAMAAAQNRLSVLHRTAVGELVKNKGPLEAVPYSTSVRDTLNLLLAHNLIAVPVTAPPGHWIGAGGTMIMESDEVTGSAKKQYIGMVSTFDLLIHLADERLRPDLESRLSGTVSSVIGHSMESLSLWTISPSTSVYEAMEPMTKGIHRALVPVMSHMHHGSGVEISEYAAGYKMLSQTDLIMFLRDQRVVFEFLCGQTVREAMQENIFAVPGNMKLMQVVTSMWDASVTAVAVYEPSRADLAAASVMMQPGTWKKAICTFSASDLRSCGSDALQLWSSGSVLEFLCRAEVAKRSGLEAATEADQSAAVCVLRTPVTCSPNDTVAEAMLKALESKVHQVWVTDYEGLLQGVVTLSDILRVVREHVVHEHA